jgi:hypothetical protein
MATCINGVCNYPGLPIDIADGMAAAGLFGNLRSMLRMHMTLHPDASQSRAPTIYGWELTYVCTTAF